MGSDLRTSTRTWWIIAAAAAALLLGLLQPMAPTASAAEPPADYVGVTPLRVADTRSGTGVARGRLQARTVLEVDTASASSVPVNAEAVWLNVTVTDPDAPGWLAAYPCGSTRPNASNLNFTSEQTIANAVAVAVGDSGRVCIYTAATAHVIVDLNGYFPAASAYTAGNPTRLADTRTGSGVRAGRVERGQVLTVPVGGRAGVPADAKAASLNVTVTEPATTGFVTVFPCGQSRPTASNLNFTAGQSIPNAVVAKLGEKGTICLFTSATTHLIVDVNGAYAADSVYTPRNAVRAADTRNGTGVRAGRARRRNSPPSPYCRALWVPRGDLSGHAQRHRHRAPRDRVAHRLCLRDSPADRVQSELHDRSDHRQRRQHPGRR